MSTTYNNLVASVLSYVQRADAATVANMPTFILNAQQRLCRESKNIGLLNYVTGNLTPGVFSYAKPALWRRNITFNYGSSDNFQSRNPLELRSYEYLVSYWPDRTKTAEPKFYSDYSYSGILIAPTPDKAYPFEWGYLSLPTPITPDNQTNWWTDYAPDVLLYATIIEALYFLKNTESIPPWKEMYDIALASLNLQDDLRVDDRQTNRRAD